MKEGKGNALFEKNGIYVSCFLNIDSSLDSFPFGKCLRERSLCTDKKLLLALDELEQTYNNTVIDNLCILFPTREFNILNTIPYV